MRLSSEAQASSRLPMLRPRASSLPHVHISNVPLHRRPTLRHPFHFAVGTFSRLVQRNPLIILAPSIVQWFAVVFSNLLLPGVSIWHPDILVVCRFRPSGPYRRSISWTTTLATTPLVTKLDNVGPFHGSCAPTISPVSVQ